MKYIQKTIILSLVIALVSFTGDFCTHPMAQADDHSSMEMSILPTSDHDMQMHESTSLAISTCVFDCINQAPQATVGKKTSINTNLSLSFDIFQTESLDPVFISDTFGAVGTHPPSPDILSSIMKRE
ncbi:MAG: hypothetical protein WCG73_00935 [Candidatus Moraniibacteriota bacterium]